MAIQHVWKSGNSLVITIPAKLALKTHLTTGTTIFLRTDHAGRLVIVPVWSRPSKPRSRIRRQLKSLVQRK